VPGGRGPHDAGCVRGLPRGVLAPSLRPGQVVVRNNLSAHKGGRVKEIVEGRGCEILYLPPYSPDPNLIEQAFSKVKGLLRRGRISHWV
jgi:transposase